VAALIGALAMAPIGVLIGALTIRLGELYVALVTLSFGLLVDTVVFSSSQFIRGSAASTWPGRCSPATTAPSRTSPWPCS